MNDTAELEARVTVLEEQMVDVEDDINELTDEIDDVETANILQDGRLNSIDDDISNNEDTINSADSLSSSPLTNPRGDLATCAPVTIQLPNNRFSFQYQWFADPPPPSGKYWIRH